MPEFEKLPEGYSIDRRIEESRVSQQQQEGAGYEALPQGYRLPGTEPTAYEKDYAAMPWSEVASSAAKEAIPSFGRALKAIPEAVINYEETGQALKQAVQGAGSKIRGAFGEKQDPAQKAETEGIINAMMEPFTSVAGFKKALATDPFSVLSTAAIPVTGGAAGLAKGAQLAGTATTAGKALSGLSKAAGTTATLMDPLSTTLAAGKLAGEKIAIPTAKKTASVASGIGPESLEQIYQAGKSPDQAIKNGFNTWAKGEGNSVDLSQDMAKSLSKLKADEFKSWRSSKEGILADKTDVSFDPVFKAIREAKDVIGDPRTATGSSAQAHRILSRLEDEIASRAASAPGSIERSLGAFDQLKRTLWNDSKKLPPMAASAYNTVRNGVSEAIGAAAPKYPGLMHDYQALLDNLNNIKSTLGTKDNVAATSEILKLIRAQNDVSKNQLISQLAKYDPTIPYKIAGAAVNQAVGNPAGWTQALTAAQWANLGAALGSMNPAHIAAATLGIGGQRLFGSPQNVSAVTYTAGKIAGSKPVQVLEEAAPAITAGRRAIQGPLQRTQDEELMEQFRPQRASGGRVSDKLVTMVDRARKNINNQTESLLSTHDNHVARALEIANQNLEG